VEITNNKMESYTEENYLKAIYALSDHGLLQVNTKALSESLNNKPSTVSDMLRKLSEKQLIYYKKYNGAKLTGLGKKKSLNIIRKHRLWELFLVKHFGFTWDEVHEVAEQLEHVKSDLLIEKLDQFLGFPTADPHGDPIPDAQGRFRSKNKTTLYKLKPGNQCIVTGIKDSSAAFLQYLNKIQIGLNTIIIIIESYSYDESILIQIDGNKELTISKQVSKNLYVKPVLS
jgi:DtxR family transcriptional regulator, Mn-dependent transcriptional regulator